MQIVLLCAFLLVPLPLPQFVDVAVLSHIIIHIVSLVWSQKWFKHIHCNYVCCTHTHTHKRRASERERVGWWLVCIMRYRCFECLLGHNYIIRDFFLFVSQISESKIIRSDSTVHYRNSAEIIIILKYLIGL